MFVCWNEIDVVKRISVLQGSGIDQWHSQVQCEVSKIKNPLVL